MQPRDLCCAHLAVHSVSHHCQTRDAVCSTGIFHDSVCMHRPPAGQDPVSVECQQLGPSEGPLRTRSTGQNKSLTDCTLHHIQSQIGGKKAVLTVQSVWTDKYCTDDENHAKHPVELKNAPAPQYIGLCFHDIVIAEKQNT